MSAQMSELAYLKARFAKAYIGGKWVPITSIPKKELLEMKAAGRFGQKHLKDVDTVQNALRNQMVGQARHIRETAPKGGQVKNMYTGQTMQRTRPGSFEHDSAGPHIAMKTTPKGSHAYREADEESMRRVKPAAVLQHWGGARFRTGAEGIEAHEHAHGMARRTGPTIFAGRMQRAMDQEKDRISRLAASKNPSMREGQELGRALGNRMKRIGLREEVRADIMASRKTGRTMVSGHVKDTGRAKDYIDDRRMIEQRMGMKPTKKREIVYPISPKHATYGAAGVGGGAATYVAARNYRDQKKKLNQPKGSR